MSSTGWKPDVIVGVDFGMTSTGVAYSWAPDWPRPETIQHWPGTPGSGLADKVDTVLAYDSRDGHLTTWGFTADLYNPDFRIEENFKLFLDPEYRDNSHNAPSLKQAQQWYLDYLSCIPRSISRYFVETIPKWNDRNVEFVFSVPTTWKDPAMIEQTRQLIKNAGFGTSLNHRVDVFLTEAEAAGVCVAKNQYEKGDVFLVCDAGGGTTDINILKVSSSDIGKTELEPLSNVEGEAIGSTLIDFNVEGFLRECLQKIRRHLGAEPNIIAHRMMKQGRFESFKCSYGKKETNALDVPLQVPTLPPGLDFPQAQIADSKIVITRRHLQSIFDEQIDRIYNLVDNELRKLQTSHARENVSYLVLSGGLGSSAYVRSRLQMRYERGAGDHANAENLKILTAPKPQLAVVHGLVMERIQNLKEDRQVYPSRRCRTSYGVVVRQLYDLRDMLEKMSSETLETGELVSVKEGKKHAFKRKLDPGKEHNPWSTQIVMSVLPANQLPRSLKRQGARPVCAVESLLETQDMKLKNRHWYNRKPRYWRAEFFVRVLILAATLQFEIVKKDGMTVSRSHDQIQVKWMPSTKEDVTHDVEDMAYGLEDAKL